MSIIPTQDHPSYLQQNSAPIHPMLSSTEKPVTFQDYNEISIPEPLKQLSNHKKAIIYAILFFPLTLNALRSGLAYFESLDSLSNSEISKIPFFEYIYSLHSSTLGTKALFFVLPIIAISVVEIAIRHSPFFRTSASQRQGLSLQNIRASEGFAAADVWYYLIGIIQTFWSQPFFVLTLGAAYFIPKLSSLLNPTFSTHIPSFDTALDCTIAMIAAILLDDFIHHISHRIEHKSQFLWQFHEFHHSATQMTILSNYRTVSFIRLFLLPVSSLPQIIIALIIAGSIERGFMFPFVLFTVYITMSQCFRYVAHSSLMVTLPKPLDLIFMSPSLHSLHHAKNPEYYDCNFSMVFSIWDRILGSYRGPEHLPNISGFGIEKSEYNRHHPLYSMYVIPARRLFCSLKSIFKLHVSC